MPGGRTKGRSRIARAHLDRFSSRPSPAHTFAAALAVIAVALAVAVSRASANQPIGESSPACHYDGFSYYAGAIVLVEVRVSRYTDNLVGEMG